MLKREFDILTKYDEFVDKVWLGDGSGKKGKENLRELYIMSTGLGGETGEVLEKLKKYIRDDTFDKNTLKKELGDVLYYLTKIAHEFDMTLEEILMGNVEKLNERLKNNTMRGSGDNR